MRPKHIFVDICVVHMTWRLMASGIRYLASGNMVGSNRYYLRKEKHVGE